MLVTLIQTAPIAKAQTEPSVATSTSQNTVSNYKSSAFKIDPRDRAWQFDTTTPGFTSWYSHNSSPEPLAEWYPLRGEFDYQPIYFLGRWAALVSLESRLPFPKKGSSQFGSPELLFTATAGIGVRYQGYWVNNQWVVPTVLGEYNAGGVRNRYKGWISGTGARARTGAWINLGAIDKNSIKLLRNEFGIERTFLTVEAERLWLLDGYFSSSWVNAHQQSKVRKFADALIFGLRFEM